MSEISSSKSELKSSINRFPLHSMMSVGSYYVSGWLSDQVSYLCLYRLVLRGFGSLLLRLLFRILQFIYCRISICVHFLNLITVLIIPVSLRNI